MGFRQEEEEEQEEEEAEEEEEEEEEEAEEEEEEEEEEEAGSRRKRKYRRSQFIDDVAEEDDDEEEEEEAPRKRRHRGAAQFIDDTAAVASDEDEEEEEGEEDFIQDEGADLQDEEDSRRMHRRAFLPRDEQEQDDVEEMEKLIQQRYGGRQEYQEYDEETTEVEQQALLPSVKDPKLWMVKCQLGHEREAAVCLMQKYLDLQAQGQDLQIKSAIALDHLKGYLYVEAEKEAYVGMACKGLRMIYSYSKVMLVPIKEMTDVLSVESKSVELSKDTWVRVKSGIYKGDLAKVMDVDHVRQRVTIKLIPRIDLQALAAKLEGKTDEKKKAFRPPPRFISISEVKDMRIPVDRKRDSVTGEIYDTFEGLLFKDSYLIKTVSMKTITASNIQPTFDELQKFQKPGDEKSGDAVALTSLLANRKKGHFVKGDAVVVIEGDLKNLMGIVEKVDDGSVFVRPKYKGLKDTLTFRDKQLCKFFKTGDHVKVVSGAHEGSTGMVVKVENHVLVILSDTTKEDIRVFADNVVESSEVTSGLTKFGDYELHDLVLLDQNNVGLIIRVETDCCQILKGIPEKQEVATVKLRDLRRKIFDRRHNVQDRFTNSVSLKDIVRIVEGPFKGKQGPVEHIYRSLIFILDRRYPENGGFICVRSNSCVALGGSKGASDTGTISPLISNFGSMKPPSMLQSPRRTPLRTDSPRGGFAGGHHGHRGRNNIMGKTVKIRQGPFKGYRGRVVDATDALVRIELESQMKVVSVRRDQLADSETPSAYRDSPRPGIGSETPIHPSRTPLHPFMTPMRDASATPIHDGMRTPMRDRAWNPYSPMTPLRETGWEDGNPATWSPATSPYQPGTPIGRPYEAPTPGSGWANSPAGSFSEAGTPRGSPTYGNAMSPYLPSTPGGPPMTPGAPAYLPGTPGGQPMTPGNGGLEAMSPVAGGHDVESNWCLPDILVNLHKFGDDSQLAVVREVLPDGSCKVALGQSGSGDCITVHSSELEVSLPRKNDKIKIIHGEYRNATGRLIGIDGADGIVKMDETLDIKILDMSSLASVCS